MEQGRNGLHRFPATVATGPPLLRGRKPAVGLAA
jgi:hypothetical protein